MTTLHAQRGDGFQAVVTWTGPAPDRDPIDLTGYTVEFLVTINGVEVAYDDTPEITVTPLTGRIDILIDEDVTELWGTSGTYRLRVNSPSDLPTTLVRGNLEVR